MSGRGVLALACVLAAVTSGCAAKLREIPTHSLSKRSPAVVERDLHQCEKAVTGHLKGPWLGGELEFAACMIARNYQTFVQVLDAPLEVRRASLKGKVTSARVLNDLVACEQFVSARVSVVEKIGRPLVKRMASVNTSSSGEATTSTLPATARSIARSARSTGRGS